MLKSLVIVALVSLNLSVQTPAPSPVPKEKELSELSVAKATVHLLSIQVEQLKAENESLKNQLASVRLTNDRTVLEALFRKELGCKDTDKFDWSTLKCGPNVKKNPS